MDSKKKIGIPFFILLLITSKKFQILGLWHIKYDQLKKYFIILKENFFGKLFFDLVSFNYPLLVMFV